MNPTRSKSNEPTSPSKDSARSNGRVDSLARRMARCVGLAWDLVSRDHAEIALMEQWVRSGGFRDTQNNLEWGTFPAQTTNETAAVEFDAVEIKPVDDLAESVPAVLDIPPEPLNGLKDTAKDDAKVQRGLTIATEVIGRLQMATETTEVAALEIGNQVSSLLSLAQAVNESATRSLANVVGHDAVAIESGSDSSMVESEPTVVELIYGQKTNLSAFIDATEQFVHAQETTSRGSTHAVLDVRDCVRRIDKIVLSSEVLALNVQIESVRLGEDGKAFSVLGQQMSDFSRQIHEANQAIQKAVGTLAETIGQTTSQSEEMGGRLAAFSSEMDRKMDDLEDRTNGLSDTLHQTLTEITTSNDKMMSCSRSALSALQFQDPLSQDLLRSVHEIRKIQSLIEVGDFEDTRLADIDPSIGNDGAAEREAGVVELF